MKQTFQLLVRKRILISQVILLVVCMSACGGCVLCGGEVNVQNSSKSSSIVINVSGLQATAPATGHDGITTVTCSGNLTHDAGGTGETSFSVSRNYEITRSSADPSIPRLNLKPGTWTVTVSAKGWTTQCNGTITTSGSSAFNFTYHVNGCNH
jgi:hypothetical protein